MCTGESRPNNVSSVQGSGHDPTTFLVYDCYSLLECPLLDTARQNNFDPAMSSCEQSEPNLRGLEKTLEINSSCGGEMQRMMIIADAPMTRKTDSSSAPKISVGALGKKLVKKLPKSSESLLVRPPEQFVLTLYNSLCPASSRPAKRHESPPPVHPTMRCGAAVEKTNPPL